MLFYEIGNYRVAYEYLNYLVVDVGSVQVLPDYLNRIEGLKQLYYSKCLRELFPAKEIETMKQSARISLFLSPTKYEQSYGGHSYAYAKFGHHLLRINLARYSYQEKLSADKALLYAKVILEESYLFRNL